MFVVEGNDKLFTRFYNILNYTLVNNTLTFQSCPCGSNVS